MLEAVRNAFRLPDLRQKLLITFGILVLYRFAANIPLPAVDREALAGAVYRRWRRDAVEPAQLV